jgi:hypothetical protein
MARELTGMQTKISRKVSNKTLIRVSGSSIKSQELESKVISAWESITVTGEMD